MPSAFENLCGPGKPLKAESPDTDEFAGLKRSGLARLKDAATASLSLESRFDLAYNAAHALCFAAVPIHERLHRGPETLEALQLAARRWHGLW